MTAKAEKPTFEQSIERIETIINQLERGETDLQTSLKYFEEGIGLLKNCDAILTSAKEKIAVWQGTDENGKPILKNFSFDDFKTDSQSE